MDFLSGQQIFLTVYFIDKDADKRRCNSIDMARFLPETDDPSGQTCIILIMQEKLGLSIS